MQHSFKKNSYGFYNFDNNRNHIDASFIPLSVYPNRDIYVQHLNKKRNKKEK